MHLQCSRNKAVGRSIKYDAGILGLRFSFSQRDAGISGLRLSFGQRDAGILVALAQLQWLLQQGGQKKKTNLINKKMTPV